jgi:fatty aldehyde-generating acyl-ACP reductase
LGAQILGLGAFTSVVGDAGLTVAKALEVPVTTGDAYTVAIAVQAVQEAARRLEIDLPSSAAAVVGATGAIGQVCAQLLAREAGELYLIGRRPEALAQLKERLHGSRANIITSSNVENLRKAELVITVSSALDTLIRPEHLQPGSVICDVARPRDVSVQVARARPDVLVIDGGMVDIPGQVDFHFNFGFPPGKAYACMAETMALALEGRFEDYTLGRDISLARVEEISKICHRHGFHLSGFRSFERAVTDEMIEQIWTVRQKRGGPATTG